MFLLFNSIVLSFLFFNLFVRNQYFLGLTLLFISKPEDYSLLLTLSILVRIDNKCRLIKLFELILSLLYLITMMTTTITYTLPIKMFTLSQWWHSWGIENRSWLCIKVFVYVLIILLFILLVLIVYVG